jgi:hypothetical protein
MKNLFYKILAIFGMIFAIFQLGKKSGKTTLKNEINKKTLEDVKETQKIKNRISKLTIDEQYDRL